MRETTDSRDKQAIADALTAYRRGRIGRRTMLKTLAAAGVALGGAPHARRAAAAPRAQAADITTDQPEEMVAWLRDVGGQFEGSTIKVVSEETPPSRAIINLKAENFEAITGITVDWEVVPLDQVLAKVSQDAATRAGANDIYYLDQAWVGRFINDTVDPRERLESQPDLAMPDYNIDDFLEPLVRQIASYGDKMIGFPCDVPIFMYFYRRDVYDQLGLQPATTMPEYLAHAQAINAELGGQGTYGTVGQMKSGHYALNVDMTAWVWSHGGSVFTADEQCSLNDEQALQGLNYMLELQKTMPAAVTTYDWGGQFTAIQQGQGGQVITWGEDFPGWDGPDSSVTGMMEPAPLPANVALRPPAEAGFEEVPDLGHQGGSTYSLSAYSKNADPAWVFLQWATSSNTQTLASVIGGGASPMRQSTFDDPRVKAMELVGVAGTTRHFPAMLEVINTRMGTEPHLPQWPLIATDIIAVELGKLTTGGYDSAQEAADEITRLVNEAASG